MIRRRHAALALAAIALLVPLSPAAAEDAAPEKPTKYALDGAYVKTGGNTDVTSISGGDKLAHTAGSWIFT
ncbi:MAG TPA: hypothetical protein VFS09_06175, partial [Candidatus Eisenbacteria bacterium]|nr:hypothetical protein [Candidatus Eisenbacteria bacterium]